MTWQLLSDGLPGGFTAKERRNRLILLLAMRCALTVSEIVEAKLEDVTEASTSPDHVSFNDALTGLPLLQPESPFWQASQAHPIYRLVIRSTKFSKVRPMRSAAPGTGTVSAATGPKAVLTERALVLDARTSKALFDWLEIRRAPLSDSDRLFPGTSDGGGMITKAIYNICRAHILKCLGADAMTIEHLGPNTLRNTCISIWRNLGGSDAEVARRIGLRDTAALYRLNDHKLPEVRL